MTQPPLTLGTAGHIDHGKTVLVNVLTGVNTDRLPEERSRGISIDLGFAPLELPSGRRLSVVDVPGHERFVRTMVAGATGIDCFLLVVAADDGVMPQTTEHLAVLRLLEVPRGVVALTKCDLVDEDAVALAGEEIRETLAEAGYADAEIIPVSAPTGQGLDELRAALDRMTAGLPGRASIDGAARLPVDRSFTLKGVGTVVTGTLWSGTVAAGDPLKILPSGIDTRARSVQVHDQPVDEAAAGRRVAINLPGIHREEVRRGDVVAGKDASVRPSYRLEARLALLPGASALTPGARVHLHHGTCEVEARVYPRDGEGTESTGGSGGSATTAPATLTPGKATRVELRCRLPVIAETGDRFILRSTSPPATIGGGEILALQTRRTPEDAAAAQRERALAAHAGRVLEALRKDGFEPRSPDELAAALAVDPAQLGHLVRSLAGTGELVQVEESLFYHPEALEKIEQLVVAACRERGAVTIADVRDLLGTSRKYAVPLAEHFDAAGVTRREGDGHVLRGPG